MRPFLWQNISVEELKAGFLQANKRQFIRQKNNYLRVVYSKNNCTLFIIYKHNADRLHITFAHDSSHIYAQRF